VIYDKSVIDYFRKRNASIFQASLIQKQQFFIFFTVGFIRFDTVIVQ